MNKAIVAIGIFVIIIGAALIALPFAHIPKTVSEPYEAQRSSVVFDETFAVPVFVLDGGTVTHTAYLNRGDLVNIQLKISGLEEGDLTFAIFSGSVEYVRYQGNEAYYENWTVPYSSDYDFRYSAAGIFGSAKTVTELVTKHWTETAYMDVTTDIPLLPFEFAYLGIALVAVGIGITAYGIVKKETVPSDAIET